MEGKTPVTYQNDRVNTAFHFQRQRAKNLNFDHMVRCSADLLRFGTKFLFSRVCVSSGRKS